MFGHYQDQEDLQAYNFVLLSNQYILWINENDIIFKTFRKYILIRIVDKIHAWLLWYEMHGYLTRIGVHRSLHYTYI